MSLHRLPLLLLLPLLLACGGSEPARPFNVVMRAHPVLTEKAGELAQSFRRATGMELHLETLPADDYDRKLMALLAERINTPPDVAESFEPALLRFLKTARPWNPVLDAWPRPARNEIFSDFIRQRTGPDGTVAALNLHYPDPAVLVARRDWLAEAGTGMPGTVTELTAAAVAAVRRSRPGQPVYGYGWDTLMFHLFLKAGDGRLISYDTGAGCWVPAFTSIMAREELGALNTLYRSGAIAPGQFGTPPTDNGSALFRAGRLMFLPAGTRTAAALYRDMGPARVTVGSLPRGTVKPAGGSSPAWCAVNPLSAPERLTAFLDWWYSPETFALLASPAPDALIPEWLNFDRDAGTGPDSSLAAVLSGIISRERIQFSDHHRLPELREIVDRYWGYAVTDSLQPADAVEAAVREIEKKHLLR